MRRWTHVVVRDRVTHGLGACHEALQSPGAPGGARQDFAQDNRKPLFKAASTCLSARTSVGSASHASHQHAVAHLKICQFLPTLSRWTLLCLFAMPFPCLELQRAGLGRRGSHSHALTQPLDGTLADNCVLSWHFFAGIATGVPDSRPSLMRVVQGCSQAEQGACPCFNTHGTASIVDDPSGQELLLALVCGDWPRPPVRDCCTMPCHGPARVVHAEETPRIDLVRTIPAVDSRTARLQVSRDYG